MWFSAQPKTMQDFGDYCNQMETDQVLTLKDARDNNNYTVAKLKDGQCWMTQNLKLGNNQPITLTPEGTDTAIDYILPASGTESDIGYQKGTNKDGRHLVYIQVAGDYQTVIQT